MEDHPLISIKQASALTSLSRGAINILRRQGDFPAAVQLGEKRIAFVRAEVDFWIRQRIAARTQVAA
ncbi:AlpA family phage regulatory protein [Mesorhizobium sp. B2-7-3]|uniref:helix-turn-helix transcriptional regulator n=1 Tax=unclassified Mesorhizobium TaxID=325217 RepID=UPI00112B3DED|nr:MULTISPECIES: AlpA family phage regulatory protein [unclassified Mesorhizobium]TPJ11431.1 AlpA family phage regulatory protein [Mesorhizobium sp. B2-7-3]TPK71596.1 AlpA family phage regulatory protein [Mesorhizobium sp. B2-4-18]